jgi:alkylated DNA repair dioxygenase AlkB
MERERPARGFAGMAQADPQFDLFAAPAATPALPDGLRYREELITRDDEAALVAFIRTLPLQAFEFAGGFRGHRRVLSFGWRYDYSAQKLLAAEAIPADLMGLRGKVARFAGRPVEDFGQALVTEYAPGAGIGWHKDKRMYGDIAGVSLLAPCRFRLRRKRGDSWQRAAFEAQPRSAYILSGESRRDWEHSIPPLAALRYSVTFRTFAR